MNDLERKWLLKAIKNLQFQLHHMNFESLDPDVQEELKELWCAIGTTGIYKHTKQQDGQDIINLCNQLQIKLLGLSVHNADIDVKEHLVTLLETLYVNGTFEYKKEKDKAYMLEQDKPL